MPDDEFLPPVLARTLAELHDVEPDDDVLSRTRADLMAKVAATPTRRRHWGRWAAAAAVVISLAGWLLVAPTLTTTTPAASAAGEVLIKAADKIKNVDPVIWPGQYLYAQTLSWHLTGGNGTSGKGYEFLAETKSEIWIPADVRQEWLGRFTTTGQRQWVVGTEAQARADGVALDGPMVFPDGEVRARCGDFTAPMEKREPCVNFGGWIGGTTPEFLASLPTDPQDLYDLLRKETAGRGQDPDVEMLVYTQNVIGSPQAPAKIRATFYRALALMPSLQITEQVATLDGQTGTAIGVDSGQVRMEFVIDPDTGQLVGSRTWTAQQLTSTRSTHTAVVEGMGTHPS
jgi:hypothetical protein